MSKVIIITGELIYSYSTLLAAIEWHKNAQLKSSWWREKDEECREIEIFDYFEDIYEEEWDDYYEEYVESDEASGTEKITRTIVANGEIRFTGGHHSNSGNFYDQNWFMVAEKSDQIESGEEVAWLVEVDLEDNDAFGGDYDPDDYSGEEVYFDEYEHMIDWIKHACEVSVEKQRKEAERMEREEQQRREEEERKKQRAHDAAIAAFGRARVAIKNYEFEKAENIIDACRGDCNHANVSQKEIQNNITSAKRGWVQAQLKWVQELISKKNFVQADNALAGIDSRRIAATGTQGKVADLRKHLKHSEEEEKERIRREREANRKKAIEISRAFVESWKPTPQLVQIAKGMTSMEMLIADVSISPDGEFLQTEQVWKKDEHVISAAEVAWQHGTTSVIRESLKETVEEISRENALTNKLLAVGYTDNISWKISTIISCINSMNPLLSELIVNRPEMIEDSLVDSFSHRFIRAQEEYIEEMRRRKNTENAMKITGHSLGMSEEKDLNTRIVERYRGDVKIDYYVEDSTKPTGKRWVGTDEVKHLIESGENIIIVLEECLDESVQEEFGDLYDEETEKQHDA